MMASSVRSLGRRYLPALVLTLVAGAVPVTPVTAAPSNLQDPKARLDEVLERYDRVRIDAAQVARQVRAGREFTLETSDGPLEIVAWPNDLRAPHYRAQITQEDGSTRVLARSEVTTFAGVVRNREDATVRLTLERGAVSGMILKGGEKLFFEPVREFSPSAEPTDYVLYRESDLKWSAAQACGTTEAQRVLQAVDDLSEKASGTSSATGWVADVATEADNEFVAAFSGNHASANNDILGVLNQVDGVYQAELGITLRVVLQNTYAGSDPYTVTTDASALLNEFRAHWNANMGGVARDIAHMWTGRDMAGSTIGIAWVGVVCRSATYAYGVSQRWGSGTQKAILTAHEIGHNFNGCHSNTSCNPNTLPCDNTIMQSFVGSGFTFCQFSRDQIVAFASANASCLASAAPPSAAPTGLAAAAAGSSTINLTWADNSNNEAGFQIERSTGAPGAWTLVATAGANATSYSNTGLAQLTTYFYRVRAVNSSGQSAYSNEASSTTTGGISAPTNLAVTSVSGTQVTLSWVDTSVGEAGFRVERSLNGTSYSVVATVGSNVTTYADRSVRKNKTYWYRVRAYAGTETSAYSNVVSVRTPR
jgi:hypothetical protein